MYAVFKREVKSYFYSPIAYVLIGLFILISSVFFFMGNLMYQVADFNNNLDIMAYTLMFIVPILTMRILAEDRKNGTEVLLLTSPTSLTEIVVGKYLAALFVFAVMVCITLIYPSILFMYGEPAGALMFGAYIGFFFLGATLISLGVFASALSENQIVVAIISFVSIMFMMLIEPFAGSQGGYIAKVLNWFSVYSRYRDFTKGILNLSPIIYYISFIAVFLFLTIRLIEKRRWSQG